MDKSRADVKSGQKNLKPGLLCLGLTGRMSSGKGEVVMICQSFNFRYISLSDIVRETAASLGNEVSRSEMQDIGNNLRKQGGAGILGKKVREKIENLPIEKWVIDGIRNPAEVIELRKLPHFFLLGIEAEIPVILRRLQNRNRSSDVADEIELKQRLNREWGDGEPADGQRVGTCMEMADLVLQNNGSLAELTIKTVEILKKLESGIHEQ